MLMWRLVIVNSIKSLIELCAPQNAANLGTLTTSQPKCCSLKGTWNFVWTVSNQPDLFSYYFKGNFYTTGRMSEVRDVAQVDTISLSDGLVTSVNLTCSPRMYSRLWGIPWNVIVWKAQSHCGQVRIIGRLHFVLTLFFSFEKRCKIGLLDGYCCSICQLVEGRLWKFKRIAHTLAAESDLSEWR